VPVHVRRHLLGHLAASYAWMLAAGALALATGAGLLPSGASAAGARDMIVHSLTLGFMFNVIFGVDAVLLYGHAGIPLSRVPRPTPLPGILLNTALILRLAHSLGYRLGGAVLLSGPLAGLGIALFYALNMTRMMRAMRRMKAEGGN